MDDNPVTDGEIALAKGQWVCARPYGERTGLDYGFYAALVNLQAKEIAVAFRSAHVKHAPPAQTE
jgi:hypothetical protein